MSAAQNTPDAAGASVLTIGVFDGVHLGHQALLTRAREVAARVPSRPVVRALAFDPHPMEVLNPTRAPARLSTWAQRRDWLIAAGADEVERLEPTRPLLSQSPEAFLREMCAQHAPVAFVEGADFRFGKGRAGDIDALAQLAGDAGVQVEVLGGVEAALSDQTLVPVSSSRVRWLIERGRVDDAARLLGRPYEVAGGVVRGDQRGRDLGFPTANVETACMLPADGVYAGYVMTPDGEQREAAIHVGPRATFGAPVRTLEAYVLDWDGPMDDASAYGWPIRVRFAAFLRDQVRYDVVASLIEQIERDVARTRRVLREAAAGALA